MSESASAEFDSLRREATKLERHLEEKVGRYQQLAQRLTTGSDVDTFQQNSNRSSLLDSAETGTLKQSSAYGNGSSAASNAGIHEEEAALSADISRTISAMSDLINSRMSPAADRTGKSQHALLVKRYREILFDCSADFKKTSAAVARRREAMELFRGANTDGGMGVDENGNERDPAMEQLLRERNAIENSARSATSVLGQAADIHSDLRSQGKSLRGVSGTVASIAGNVPGLNTLIDNIRRKKSKDDMILSGVIASCILFTLWYVFA